MGEALPEDPVWSWRPRLIRHLYPNQPFDAAAREQARDLYQVDARRFDTVLGRFRSTRGVQTQ
jgi:hypothetical protein